MPWTRKATRYAWGRHAENELRKVVAQYVAANCRSSRSGGLFDVWAVGKYIWLFQIKRGKISYSYAVRLLSELHRKVKNKTAYIYVANRYMQNGRVIWDFYYLSEVKG